jgi:dTMP kinase
MSQGCFVVIEGPEGAGKSTLIRALGARLEAAGVEYVAFREPGGTLLAEEARRAVLTPGYEVGPASELFLMLTARADLVAKEIVPRLKAGSVILCDRFELSTFAYQIAGRGLDDAKVRAANAIATGGLTPTVTLVLDVDQEVGAARQLALGKTLDRMELAHSEFHQRVNAAYRAATGPGVVHLDAAGSPEGVLQGAWDALRRLRPDIFE